MEIEESEDTVEVEDGEKNMENLEENQLCDRRESSLHGLTKSRLCERCTTLGQSIRRCQACAKIKDLVEKKPLYDVQTEEMIEEERIEMDYDSKDKPFIVATSKYLMEMNMTLDDHLNDNKKISCNEIFPVEYEHVEEHGLDVVRTPNVITSEDRKFIKKKEFLYSNKKEYKYTNALEPPKKKEKFGYSKRLEKDTSLFDDKKEKIIEAILDVKKLNEEIDLEERERGWILDGKKTNHLKDAKKLNEEIELEEKERGWILDGRNANHLKVMSMKNEIISDGQSLGTEQREKAKVKNLKDAPETKRILGLVARRSESRLTSPTHKQRDPNKHRDHDDVEATYVIKNFFLSNTLYDKRIKLGERHHSKSPKRDIDLVYNDNDGKTLHQNINEEMVQQIDLGTKFSSPKKVRDGTQRIFNLLARRNGNRLENEDQYGTKRIFNLLARRNESRAKSMSPTQGLETNRIEEQNPLTKRARSPTQILETNRIKEQNPSTKKLLLQTQERNCNENNLLSNNTIEKIAYLDPNHGMDSEVQIHNIHHNMEPNPLSNNFRKSAFTDIPFYGTDRVLGLLARRCQSNMTSPKKINKFDKEKECLNCTKRKEIPKLEDTIERNDIAQQSCDKENHENTQSKTSHRDSMIRNQNESTHRSNEEDNKMKLQSEQDVSRTFLPSSNTSTSSGSICHVNDNPLHDTKIENESSSCSFNNANESIEEEVICDSTYNTRSKNNMKIEEKNNKELHNKKKNYKKKSDTLNTLIKPNTEILEVTSSDEIKNESDVQKESSCPSDSKVEDTSKGQTLFWPFHMIFSGLTYPFRLMWKSILYFVYIFQAIVIGILQPFKTLQNITFFGLGNASHNECNVSQGYLGCECPTKTYILIVLGSLLLPSLFDLDFHLVNRYVEGQVIIREALNFDYTKDQPTAMVNFLPHQITSKAKDFFPDKEVVAAQAFPPSHIYHIVVHLTVPESQYNHEIGMFQVVAEIFSTKGHSLYKASRASILRYHSPPMKYIKNILMGIPIVLGLSQESQTLSIRIMESHNENELSPIGKVRVDIKPKAGHFIGLGLPEVYHGELQVIAHNPYLRDVAYNWIWSVYAYSGIVLFFFEALLVLSCCRRIFLQKFGNKYGLKKIQVNREI